MSKVTDDHEVTNGCPYLVSRICEILTPNGARRFKASQSLTTAGVDEAATKIVTEDSSLMSSLMERSITTLPLRRSERFL